MSDQLDEWLRKMDSIGNWKELTVPKRVHLCRQYALEAEQLAQAAHGDLKAQYTRIAADWRKIAAELEQFGTPKSAFPTEIGGRP